MKLIIKIILIFFIFISSLSAETISELQSLNLGFVKVGQKMSNLSYPAIDNPIPTNSESKNGAIYSYGAVVGKITISGGTPGTTIKNIRFSDYNYLYSANDSISVISMTHDNLNYSKIFDSQGQMTIYIGITVQIKKSQKEGIYYGNYSFSFQNNANQTFYENGLNISLEITGDSLPIAITEIYSLSFGKIIIKSGSASIKIPENIDEITIINGDINIITTKNINRGEIYISGEKNKQISLSFSGGSIKNNYGEIININDFKYSPTNLRLDGSGQLRIKVGASINIPSNTYRGSYTGTYTVTINYA